MQAATAYDIDERWEAVVQREYGRLLNYARTWAGGNLADAQDLVQAAVCRVLKNRVDPATVRSKINFLRKVMLHIWLDERKKWSVRVVSYDDDTNKTIRKELVDEQTSRTMQSRIEDEELKEKFGLLLKVELRCLEKHERTLLHMHLQGRNTVEIAEALDEDPCVVRHDLNVIRTKVRYRLKQRAERVGYSGRREDKRGDANPAFMSGGVKSGSLRLGVE